MRRCALFHELVALHAQVVHLHARLELRNDELERACGHTRWFRRGPRPDGGAHGGTEQLATCDGGSDGGSAAVARLAMSAAALYLVTTSACGRSPEVG